jgi:isocitrate dehydrogenase (NAD+)
MMLSHVGRPELAARLRNAIDRTLNQDSIRTRDLGGTASTREFGDALIRHIS